MPAMTETEMIDRIAEWWIEYGGDAEGIIYCWPRIRDAVKRKTEGRDEE